MTMKRLTSHIMKGYYVLKVKKKKKKFCFSVIRFDINILSSYALHTILLVKFLPNYWIITYNYLHFVF